MGERRCRYCEKSFQPSKYQPQQEVCSEVGCQKRRRSEYRQQKFKADEEYRQVCRDSSRKWRSQNPDYWRQYREKHPDSVAQNRENQRARDRRQHLRDLLRNNSTSYADVLAARYSGDGGGDGITQCFGLGTQFGLGPGAMTCLITEKNVGVVGLSF
jgi:hypothetical protein